jgi:hypothetical protein
LLCFSQHQVKSTVLPAAFENPCLFASLVLLAAASMNGLRITEEPDPEVLALRQEALLLVRQQLASPDKSGAAEHIAAIQCLAGASFVSIYLLSLWRALRGRECKLPILILLQAYGFEPDVNFTIHLNALSTLLRERGTSKYKTTNLGRIILNMLAVSVIFQI